MKETVHGFREVDHAGAGIDGMEKDLRGLEG
jgi:hypothetical protein